MDASTGLALLQEGLPPLAVLCAAAWLGWRWARPGSASACAGCDRARPLPRVRLRLPVLAPEPSKRP